MKPINKKPHYNVVAAVIVNNGKTFCVQRGKTKYQYTSFKYEFPGGKIESGESEQDALVREIREELEIGISANRKIGALTHAYPDFSVTLNFWECSINEGDIVLTEHKKGVWLTLEEMKEIDWVEADKIFLYGNNNW